MEHAELMCSCCDCEYKGSGVIYDCERALSAVYSGYAITISCNGDVEEPGACSC